MESQTKGSGVKDSDLIYVIGRGVSIGEPLPAGPDTILPARLAGLVKKQNRRSKHETDKTEVIDRDDSVLLC